METTLRHLRRYLFTDLRYETFLKRLYTFRPAQFAQSFFVLFSFHLSY